MHTTNQSLLSQMAAQRMEPQATLYQSTMYPPTHPPGEVSISSRISRLEDEVTDLKQAVWLSQILITVLAVALLALACSPMVMEVLIGPRPQRSAAFVQGSKF